jgi:hypothetical protein
VMGIDDRALDSISARWTCLRMETKWDESFSAASGVYSYGRFELLYPY